MMIGGSLSFETTTGPAAAVAGGSLISVARTVRLDCRRGGLIWNRPIGVLVDQGGCRTLVPIRDRTRRIQLFLLGAGLAGSLILRRTRRRRR